MSGVTDEEALAPAAMTAIRWQDTLALLAQYDSEGQS